MKDERGLYYYPSLQTRETRMYVREDQHGGGIEFRLWSSENPVIWDKHEWLPYDVILEAAEEYKERGSDRNPLALYDLNVAKQLIKENKIIH
ncbi:hypothetical protein [Desulfovibrio gilichinskyi]|uniref:Uncharacterized protein n=1 Tax=Desulfovibrio gilichinskyi TaxID=1519643 RepID=A0A1X7DI41_9BACT|nr:hypothetical protein [Desulfovibrio gilichinskyi]SMF15798.1 hypothetical protein SAMN06295933_1930 [Desulfovibrio gilichinskyi]